MRKKTLAAFAAVYTVICLTYGILHGTNLHELSENVNVSETAYETSAEVQTTTVTTTDPEISEEQTTEETTETSASPDTTTTETTTEKQTSAEPEEIIPEQQTVTETQPPETTTIETAPPETDTTEQETYTQTEAQDVPSLQEYLQNMRCNGCRHNCSLANPRCMNGARKASQAESDYYSLYV